MAEKSKKVPVQIWIPRWLKELIEEDAKRYVGRGEDGNQSEAIRQRLIVSFREHPIQPLPSVAVE